MSYFSRVFLKRPFFNASFSEGNSLSTLELTVTEIIDVIEKSEFLQSKALRNDEFKYLLVSKNFSDLKNILSTIQKDSRVRNYQLNA